MKKKKLYQILPLVMVGICAAGMCVVGTRIFAKKVLIGKFGIENYITCKLADYNWGDRLERSGKPDIEEQNPSMRQQELEEILAGAPVPKKPSEDVVTEDGSRTLLDKINGAAKSWSQKVTAIEDDITKYCNEKFIFYPMLREVSRDFDKLTAWNLVYARKEGSTYTLNTGFDYQAVEQEDMTAYAADLVEKADEAQAAGVDFLYVQYPYRVDEAKNQVPWGASAEENANADAALELLREASVDTLDLRKLLPEQGWDYETGFYDTDGHWTTRSGFLSAGLVAEYLNENYDFSYDMSYFDEKNYEVNRYDLNSYMVKEEVELFLPAFETEFTVTDAYRGETYTGTFEEACFDMSKVDTEEYSSVLTAYSASRIRNSYLFEYQNLKPVSNGKRILVCSDSFSWHLIPYLALDTEYVDYVYKITPEQMEYYIEKLQPDMVIVLDRP